MKLLTFSTDSFISYFLESNHEFINGLAVADNWKIGLTTDHPIFRYSVLSDRMAFGTNILTKCIAINNEKCIEYKLSDTEKSAILFHEIGHLVYNIERYEKETEEDYNLRKELEADRLAVEHGMQDALLSGLRKLTVTGVFNDTISQMQARIRYWESR